MIFIIDRLGQAGNEKANRNLAIIYAEQRLERRRVRSNWQRLNSMFVVTSTRMTRWHGRSIKTGSMRRPGTLLPKRCVFRHLSRTSIATRNSTAKALGHDAEASELSKKQVFDMKSLLVFALASSLASAAFATTDLDRFLDPKLDYTPRNAACSALRGNAEPEGHRDHARVACQYQSAAVRGH